MRRTCEVFKYFAVDCGTGRMDRAYITVFKRRLSAGDSGRTIDS